MGSNRTVGLSPKLIAALAAAVATYLVTQTLLELPPLVVLLCQVVLVSVGAYFAPAGTVQPAADPAFEQNDIHEAT